MARLPDVDPASASAPVAEALDRLPPLHVFRLLAHAETAFVPWLRFGGALLGDLALDPAVRELAILQVARTAHADYEWEQHVPIAEAVGVAADQVAALRRDDLDAAATDPVQRAALELARAMAAGPEVDEATVTAVREHLPDRQVMELALVIGHYLMLARIMTAFAIDSDPPAGIGALSRSPAPRRPRS